MSRTSILAGLSALTILASGTVSAQARESDSLQLAAAAAALTLTQPAQAPLRLDRTFAGSDRLGISLAPVAVSTATRDPAAALPAQSVRHRGPGVALMIVGAAGVITGLLIEESLITILGAGTGLVGLYLYLR